MALRYVFFRDEELARVRKYNARPEVKERRRRKEQERWRSKHPIEYGVASLTDTLPCGEDCENCPYGECQYTDRDQDQLAEEVAERKRGEKAAYKAEWYIANAEEIRAAQKERYATDADYRAAAIARSHSRYEANHEEINAARRAARAALSPEEREELNAKRRAKWAALSPEEREEKNARRRAKNAALSPEKKEEINAARREKYNKKKKVIGNGKS